MFNNIPELYNYLENLKEQVDKHVEKTKEKLDYKCEVCKLNPIEVDYAYENYCDDVWEDGVMKLKINAHYFCKSCYKKIINTNQLSKSRFMKEIDSELFGS